MPDVISNAHILPGQFVRDTVLGPKRITVTSAAALLGVGRPALSNFLNGRAAVSQDMAARIEKAFGVSAQKLLDMQAAHDAAASLTKGAPADAKPYVPPFLQIKANAIEHWVEFEISARVRLSVLLRTLVNSTGVSLTKVDFPGNDDAERPGWDGFVVATEGTPWIPAGSSGWEFGCNADPKVKADGDYANRTKLTDQTVRAKTTFVFVTPRTWKGKTKWEDDRRNDGQWKDVRAFDVSNLEQWMAQSIAAQVWFADETKHESLGTRSLDRCWSEWSGIARPPLTSMLFTTAVRANSALVGSMLSKPPDAPIVIASDSAGEALAFLATLFRSDDNEFPSYRDKVVVFDRPGVLPKLAAGRSNFIAVTSNREVERELAPYSREIHTIVIYPRNAANAEPHVALEPLHPEAFRSALESMGFSKDRIERLARESGRSLTVLQRRLSNVPSVITPEWANDVDTAHRLVPFLFAGAWNSSNESDKIVLQFLAGSGEYAALERDLQGYVGINDAPTWSVGSHRGVISKIDLLFAIGKFITASELNTYFDVARLVLSEDDPALDLPEEDQWKAGAFGKTREISSVLRRGISETLVLLAVHGNTQFKARLGINVEVLCARLVDDLLTPLTTRTLELHERDLPTYAEAAPEAFLSILEKDVRGNEPASFGLMRPASTGVFGRCVRSGLLWALEGLAWSPATLSRVVLLFGRLAEIKIEDNWVNKPIESLRAVFRSWMPQTASNLNERLATMRLLAERYPRVAWTICLDQFGAYHRVGHYSHKPSWRSEGYGFGHVITRDEAAAFERAMVEMSLDWTWSSVDASMLCDLLDRIHALDYTHQSKVWELIERWANDVATDGEKARVREKIRVVVRRAQMSATRKGDGLPEDLINAAARASSTLEPADILNRHEWLFRENWVEMSAEELDEMDLEKRQAKITILRTTALKNIVEQRGIEGVLQLAEMGKSGNMIGGLMVQVLPSDELTGFILSAMRPRDASWAHKNLVFGVLHGISSDETRSSVLRQIHESVDIDTLVKVVVLAPFQQSTWIFVDRLGNLARAAYWSQVAANWPPQTDADVNTATEQLLEAKRPRAAFNCVHFKIEKLRPALLFHLMEEVAAGKDEAPGQYQLDPYYINEAFKHLDGSGEFSVDQLAGLEFVYIEALSRAYGGQQVRGIPNLERYLEDHPGVFVEAVAWVYKRDDGGEDPESLRLNDAELASSRAQRGYRLLEELQRIPGHDEFGELSEGQLIGWIGTVRRGLAELGRQAVGDISLGKLLSNAPVGKDGIWPCEPVREVLEKIESEDIARGVTNGLYNARGVHWRGEGGDQERDLAARYRRWMSALELTHPFVASFILKRMVLTYEEEGSLHDTEARVRWRL